jgi:Cd2+/Zn2+-exporting ATPase/Cu+-exporting ATPase
VRIEAMTNVQRLELPVRGMDCAECASTVQSAVARLPGVSEVSVLLAAERADVTYNATLVDEAAIRRAVRTAGYGLADDPGEAVVSPLVAQATRMARRGATLFAAVAGVVVLIVVLGEWLGLLEAAQELVPWPLALAVVLAGGLPVFRQVIIDLTQRRISSHFLMSIGVLAALAIGEFATAAIVVLFMRVGDFIERFTMTQARTAVRDLHALAPEQALVLVDGVERATPIGEVKAGDVVVVRPGERIPVDGRVVRGHSSIDQAAITGESMPVGVGAGERVFAASFALDGALQLEVERAGSDTTFGRMIRLVEEAEANQAPVQRFADRFTAYYVPVVGGVALLTWLVSGAVIPAVAVLVVACSCSIALATPVAVLASTGAAARRGVLVKGGRYFEALARSDAVLVDKTGTLTLGRPTLTGVIPLNETGEDDLLRLAASAEYLSAHPLARAVRQAAVERGMTPQVPDDFEQHTGQGVRARCDGREVWVGRPDWVAVQAGVGGVPHMGPLGRDGETTLLIARAGELLGALGVADTLREEVPAAIKALRALGVEHIELLTGDNEAVARDIAGRLGVPYRAGLLPEEKIEAVRALQAEGRRVVMIGDGINDGPALAQADVGIAIGHVGAELAMEAADITLLREDWSLVPEVFRLARRTMRVVRGNLIFTAIYNVLGIGLAAVGILPPTLAAAAQSLPDLGVMGNSSRLLRKRAP